ncbi:MAG: hypothetical protein V3R16_02560 [Nitrospirales bacterium]
MEWWHWAALVIVWACSVFVAYDLGKLKVLRWWDRADAHAERRLRL